MAKGGMVGPARVAREEIEAERAAWPAGGRGRPTRRSASYPHPVSPALRLVRGGGAEAARTRSPEDDGHPSVLGRIRVGDRAYPLEVRVWARKPPGVAEAVYHPSGVWIRLRALD